MGTEDPYKELFWSNWDAILPLSQRSEVNGQGTTKTFRDRLPAQRTDGEAWIFRPRFCLGGQEARWR